MENKWKIDSFGSSCALGFYGDKDFIIKSHNFAINTGLTKNKKLKYIFDYLAYIVTTKNKILNALYKEKYWLFYYQELKQQTENAKITAKKKAKAQALKEFNEIESDNFVCYLTPQIEFYNLPELIAKKL